MPKYRIAIGRVCQYGTHRQEVSNFVSAAWKARFLDPDLRDQIDELIDIPVARFPTDCARNCLVDAARELKADLLFMLDEDASPDHSFFKSSIQFLTAQPTPSIVGAAYMSGDGEVQVYRLVPCHSTDPQQPTWRLLKIPRAEAFNSTGIKRVASIGTHTICYDMRVFDKLAKPYFRYTYNADHTMLAETEEMYCHRHCFERDIPIFCDWDRWSGHWKMQEIGPLENIPPEELPEFWRDRAREYYLHTPEGRRELVEQMERERESKG
jgi:hypothetical protein